MNNRENTGTAEYISRQIAVYKTNIKLVELIDKLNPAPPNCYAHIHAQPGDNSDGKKVYSNIGVTLQDYSGDKTVKATANISPDEAQFIFSRVQSCVEKFEFSSEKIFGAPDTGGYSSMTKLKILRSSVGSDGQPRKYPYYIECENGRGISARNKTGGTYCQSGSFRSDIKIYLNLSDLDFFKLFNRVSSYITAWEMAYGIPAIKAGRTALEKYYSDQMNQE